MTKKIDWNTGLTARGLFALASEYYRKSREAELALITLLGINENGYGGCISDEIYDNNPNFDRGLEKSEITITPPPKRARKR